MNILPAVNNILYLLQHAGPHFPRLDAIARHLAFLARTAFDRFATATIATHAGFNAATYPPPTYATVRCLPAIPPHAIPAFDDTGSPSIVCRRHMVAAHGVLRQRTGVPT